MKNNRFNLIGLTGIAEDSDGNRIGSARVGKDEIGKMLCDHQRSHVQLSFAAPIYDIVHHAFGIPKRILSAPTKFQKEEQLFEPWGMTMREMLQTVGTELFRHNVDPEFWVKRMELELKTCTTRAVITDVRMENEAALIRSRGGVVIHVHRRIEGGKVRPHESETKVEEHPDDLHIFNYGSLEDLHNEVGEVILKNL